MLEQGRAFLVRRPPLICLIPYSPRRSGCRHCLWPAIGPAVPVALPAIGNRDATARRAHVPVLKLAPVGALEQDAYGQALATGAPPRESGPVLDQWLPRPCRSLRRGGSFRCNIPRRVRLVYRTWRSSSRVLAPATLLCRPLHDKIDPRQPRLAVKACVASPYRVGRQLGECPCRTPRPSQPVGRACLRGPAWLQAKCF
jgi:hypothetical protein